MTSDFRVTLITTATLEEAKRIAQGLVANNLAACVNIIPLIHSVYKWQGEIQADEECLLLCKTEASCWDSLCCFVKEHHSYTNPEIIQIPIVAGTSEYLDWLSACLQK